MKKVLGLLLMFSILVSSLVLASERIPVEYIKTSDGDTARFKVNGENIRVRFLGINTPEVAGEDKIEEPYGNEALEYTKNKLDNAKKIEIEYDENADKEDRFGRILAYIWVDDELFQEELVRLGYAKAYMMKANYKYADELKSAERDAKTKKLGVWSDEIIEKAPEIQEKTDNGQIITQSAEFQDLQNDSNYMGFLIIAFIVIILFFLFFGKNHKEK